MSKATPGLPYVVEKDDNLSRIAAGAYGDPKLWRIIWKANKTKIKSGNPNLIYPGEILNIPDDPVKKQLKADLGLPSMPGKERDDFTLVVDGLEIPVISGSIKRPMDTAADGWVVTIPWTPGKNEKLDKRIHPYSYLPASVYLGTTQMIDGVFYDLSIKVKNDGDTAELRGFSFTADIIDSSVTPPYESKKITLFDRAKELITEPTGVDVIFDADDTEIFDKVTASPSDTILSHLSGLATQRGILISSTRQGQCLFTTANKGKSVGTLEEGTSFFMNPSISWSGRGRFSSYKVIRRSRKKKTKFAVAQDDAVNRSRLKVFLANETTGGNLQQAVDWHRSKQLAKALEMEFPVGSWYAPNGELWEENTIVTVVSPTLLMKDGFDFIIRSVDYIFDDSGMSAVLSLIPPQAFTGEPIIEPWLRS
jgi:prophage tail gpP-like protein